MTTETIYRGFRIVPTDPVPPIPGWRDHAVTWVHTDYDGPGDRRIGTCRDDDAARADIDEWIGENGWLVCQCCGHCDDLDGYGVVGACPGNVFCNNCGTEISSDDGTAQPLCGDCFGCKLLKDDDFFDHVNEHRGYDA